MNLPIRLAIVTIMSLISNISFSQTDSIWKILSPIPGSTVRSGEVLIDVAMGKGDTLRKNSVEIWLDDYIVNFKAKITDHKITLLYETPLKLGEHRVKIYAKTADGSILPSLKWTFKVGEHLIIPGDSTKLDYAQKVTRHKPEVYGEIAINGTKREIKGDNMAQKLRQDPREIYDVLVNLKPRYRGFQFPIYTYLTSTENKYEQARNRYKFGMETRFLKGYWGDLTPAYDDYLVTGLRIRGEMLEFSTRRIFVSMLYGFQNRKIEGDSVKYNKSMGFPPYNMHKDSYYYSPVGVFARSTFAAKLVLGRLDEGSMFSAVIQKTTDDVHSIKCGEKPKQNIGITFEQVYTSQNKFFTLYVGGGGDAITNDISRGVLTKAQIKTLYGVDAPIDPDNFRKLLIINATTSPINILKGSSTVLYVKPQLRMKNNSLFVEAKKIGSDFISLANPFVQNDIRQISAYDNLSLWKRKINVTGKYVINSNNTSKSLPATMVSNSILGNITFSPGQKLPSVFFNYRQYHKNSINVSKIPNSRFFEVNDFNKTMSTGGAYTLVTGKINSTLSANYSLTNRIDSIHQERSSNTEMISGSFNQYFNTSIGYQLNYTTYSLSMLNDTFTQNTENVGGNLVFRIKKQDMTFTLGYNRSLNSSSRSFFDYSRDLINFTYRQQLLPGMILSLEYGNSSYIQKRDNTRNYVENYGRIHLTYNIQPQRNKK